MAVRRRLHRRRRPPARGLQRHAVDAAGHRSPHRSESRARVREDRVRRPSLRDGAARPPGQPARAPEREAESKHGQRLNPRKADLHRWRETFAERLREWGIDAEATRQASRGEYRNRDELWRIKAREQGRLRKERPQRKSGEAHRLSRQESLDAWRQIFAALADSPSKDDQALAQRIADFVKDMPTMTRTIAVRPDEERVLSDRGREATRERGQLTTDRTRKGPDLER